MKRLLIIPLIFFLMDGFSQENKPVQTLFHHSSTIELKGVGGPMIDLTGSTSGFACLAGGGGAVLINRYLFFGGFGYSALGGFKPEGYTSSEGFRDYFEYGGLWTGIVFFPDQPIHPVFDLKAGFGNLAIEELQDGEVFNFSTWVVRPSLQIECNVTRFMKIAVDVHYRHTGEVQVYVNDYANLSGPGIGFSFLFGWF
jgi:hypothetical protein